MNMKKLLAVTLSLALAVGTSTPASAIAEDAAGDATAPEETIIRTYTWLSTEDPEIPQTLEINGYKYLLASCTEPATDSSFEAPTRTVSITRHARVSTADDAQTALPETVLYDLNGYSGTVTRTSLAVTEHSHSEARTRTENLGTFPSNDAALLDENVIHESVIWEMVSGDTSGEPALWSATGTVRYLVNIIDNYDVTAVYQGTVQQDVQRLTSDATYSLHTPKNNIVQSVGAIAGSTVAAGFLAWALFPIILRPNPRVRIYAMTATGKKRQVLKTKTTKDGLIYHCVVPDLKQGTYEARLAPYRGMSKKMYVDVQMQRGGSDAMQLLKRTPACKSFQFEVK